MVSIDSPLYDGDFEAAAHLCLEKAAMTDRDQFPPGSGSAICRIFHDRRKRFEDARQKRMRGVTSVHKLGLTAEDLAWAAKQAHRAKDKKGWELRFTTARMRLLTTTTEKTK